MIDIESTRWCPHGKRYDDYCAECQAEEESEKLSQDWSKNSKEITHE